MAEGLAAKRAQQRIDRAKERQALEQFTVTLAHPDHLTGELVRVTTILTNALFVAAGFHRQNYGLWRKRRVQGSLNATTA
jgi:hypothetical protein